MQTSTQITKIKAEVLGIAGIAVLVVVSIGLVFSKIKETAVPLVFKLFSFQTQKEDVRCVQKAFRLKQHGIGLLAVLALVPTATALSTIPIEQAQAADSPPPEVEHIVTTNLASGVQRMTTIPNPNLFIYPITSTPAAVPLPSSCSGGAGNQKAVLTAGTFLVVSVGEWYIGRQMDKLTKDEVDKAAGQTATCGVESMQLHQSNYPCHSRIFEHVGFARRTKQHIIRQPRVRRHPRQRNLSRSDSKQDADRNASRKPSTPSKRHPRHVPYEIINSRGRIDTVIIQARGDKIAEQNNKIIYRVRRNTGDSSWRFHKHIDERKVEYNIGSYRVTSKFDDPLPKYKKLRERGIDERAHTYEATVTWKMRPLREDGRWGGRRKG